MTAEFDITWTRLERRWDRGFDMLMPEEQQTIALWWLEAEVMNGTLDQFFWNTSGNLAGLALQGLERLGLPITHAALAGAMAKFDPPYPENREARHAQLNALEARLGEKTFNALFEVESRVISELPERFVEAAAADLATRYARQGLDDGA
jgi:hypothetical protein